VTLEPLPPVLAVGVQPDNVDVVFASLPVSTEQLGGAVVAEAGPLTAQTAMVAGTAMATATTARTDRI